MQKHENLTFQIILFDGICNFCNGSVNFIIDRDPNCKFKFASLQSEIGQEYLKKNGLSTKDLDSIILIKNNKLYKKSSAVLLILKELKGGWYIFYLLLYRIPASIRDILYNLIAKNRYKFFGKSEQCRIPDPGLKNRFL
jgi:predicted DCC family thiol-disulfide oxidoreductase YuxK